MGNWAPDKEVQVRLSRVFHWVIPVDASTIKPEPEPQSPESSALVLPEEVERLESAARDLQAGLIDLQARHQALKAEIRALEEQRNAQKAADRPAFDARLEELRSRLAELLQQTEQANANLAATQTKKGAAQPTVQRPPEPKKTPNN
jgi:chromosome segregation ATPase